MNNVGLLELIEIGDTEKFFDIQVISSAGYSHSRLLEGRRF